MGNCLIKKLKVSIDNENLPIFGEVVIKVLAGTNFFSMKAKGDSNCIVTGENGVSFSSYGGSAYTNPFQLTSELQGYNVICQSNGKKVTITDKYNLAPLISSNYAIFGLVGVMEIVGGLTALTLPSNTNSVEIKLSTFIYTFEDIKKWCKNINLKKVNFEGCPNLSGEISTLNSFSDLENIGLSYCTKVTGNIDSLELPKISNIALASSGVGGTIEGLIAKQRAAGKTTGSISGNSAGWGNVTFNGSTTNAKGAVSWTATTITMNGVTINA